MNKEENDIPLCIFCNSSEGELIVTFEEVLQAYHLDCYFKYLHDEDSIQGQRSQVLS